MPAHLQAFDRLAAPQTDYHATPEFADAEAAAEHFALQYDMFEDGYADHPLAGPIATD